MTGPPVVICCKMMSESTAKTHFLLLWCCTFMGLMVRWSGGEGGFEKKKAMQSQVTRRLHAPLLVDCRDALQSNPMIITPDPPPFLKSGDVVRINFMHHFSALTFTSFTRSCVFFPPPRVYFFQSKWLFHIKKGLSSHIANLLLLTNLMAFAIDQLQPPIKVCFSTFLGTF